MEFGSKAQAPLFPGHAVKAQTNCQVRPVASRLTGGPSLRLQHNVSAPLLGIQRSVADLPGLPWLCGGEIEAAVQRIESYVDASRVLVECLVHQSDEPAMTLRIIPQVA